MGNFSWITQDTKLTIPNEWSKAKLPVYMLDDKGNRWYEPRYGGYGVFGGKDYFELVAEMNYTDAYLLTLTDLQARRAAAIYPNRHADNAVRRWKTWRYPNLVENPDTWTYNANKEPEQCESQGDIVWDSRYAADSDVESDIDEDDFKYLIVRKGDAVYKFRITHLPENIVYEVQHRCKSDTDDIPVFLCGESDGVADWFSSLDKDASGEDDKEPPKKKARREVGARITGPSLVIAIGTPTQ